MNYTTLGTGRTVKVLRTAPGQEAVVVTSCPADSVKALTHALAATASDLLAAVHPVAVAADGAPVQARRILLSRFDIAARDGAGTTSPAPAWERANALIDGLAAAVRGCPAPVVKATRAELAGHLQGLDGVLVPATVVAAGWRPATLQLVISTALADERCWPEHVGVAETTGLHPYVSAPADFADTEFDVLDQLYDQRPDLGAPYGEDSVAALFRDSGDGECPTLWVALAHLRAWAAEHAPHLLARIAVD